MYVIYVIINLVNNKLYIGSTVNLQARKANHFSMLRNGKHDNKYLQRAYNKYGKENFKLEILESCFSLQDMIQREQYWIDKLMVAQRPYGYNLCPTAGNQQGSKRNAAFRKRNSELKKGNKNCVGRVVSEETKDKIRKALTGKPLKPETLKKLREMRAKNKLSDEELKRRARERVRLRRLKKKQEKEQNESNS